MQWIKEKSKNNLSSSKIKLIGRDKVLLGEIVTILLVLMTNWLICLPSISYDLRLNLSVTRLMHMTCMLQLEREPYNPSHVHIIISFFWYYNWLDKSIRHGDRTRDLSNTIRKRYHCTIISCRYQLGLEVAISIYCN